MKKLSTLLYTFLLLILFLFSSPISAQTTIAEDPKTQVALIFGDMLRELDQGSSEVKTTVIKQMNDVVYQKFTEAFESGKPKEQIKKSLIVAYQLRDYLSSPEGSKAFGDKQEVAKDKITEIIKEVTKIGSTIPQPDFEVIKTEASKLAAESPITGVLVFPKKSSGGIFGSVTGAIDAGTNAVGSVASVPGSALGGVAGIASGGLTTSIDNAVIVADNYPAKIQTHILNDDATTTVVLSIERFSKNTEYLPERIADALVRVLQDTAEQQPEVRMTLNSVNENLGTVDNIVNSVSGLTTEASNLTESATPLVREIADLMEELNEGSRLAQDKLKFEVQNMKAIPQPEPVDLQEVNTLIQSSTETVSELRQTVEQLRMIADKGSIEESTILIGDEVEGLVDQTKSSIAYLIFLITLGIIAIIIVWYLMSAALAWFKLKVLRVELKIQHEAKSLPTESNSEQSKKKE